MIYDSLNRLTARNYPAGSGMDNITYTYDSTADVNFGKGRRTGMTDGSGVSSYRYNNRGRLIQEQKTIDSTLYTTSYSYDSADRLYRITYPSGEVVTNKYNTRSLPNILFGSTAGILAGNTRYNVLGEMTDLYLGNGTRTTFGYYGIDNAEDYYGRLYEIQTVNASSAVLQDVRHVWDAGGNLTQRQNVVASETENFTYDFLDRLTGVGF
jgi:hypothetical protein